MRKTSRGTKTWLVAWVAVLATDGLAAAQRAHPDCATYPVGATGAHRDFVFGIYTDYDDHEMGVRVARVSRGGAAEEAGLRAGDVVTAVDGRALTAARESNRPLAAQRFNAILRGLEIEEGDAFEFEVLRDDETLTVEIAPERRCVVVVDPSAVDGVEAAVRRARVVAERLRTGIDTLDVSVLRFWPGRSVAGLDVVDVNPHLGAYFGAETGVLVVEADDDSWTGLRGGDVVTHVDGRPVEDVAKLRRILRSYDEGEEVRFRIRRDGAETTVVGDMK